MRDVDQRFAFSPASAEPPRWVNVRFGLHRRIIEILDGIRELRSWADADVGQALSDPRTNRSRSRTWRRSGQRPS